jgi:hypothetical protein
MEFLKEYIDIPFDSVEYKGNVKYDSIISFDAIERRKFILYKHVHLYVVQYNNLDKKIFILTPHNNLFYPYCIKSIINKESIGVNFSPSRREVIPGYHNRENNKIVEVVIVQPQDELEFLISLEYKI